jgi:hypothetical protein
MSDTEDIKVIDDVRDVDIKVVANMMGCTTRAVRTWMVDNGLPFTKEKGRLHFNLGEVNSWAVIRELKKRNMWRPIPPTTQMCEIRQFLKDGGYRYRLQEIEYVKNEYGEETSEEVAQ